MTLCAASPSLIGAAAPAPSALSVRGLSKIIEGRAILREVTFDVRPGGFTALLGANGAGKSTLLRILATLIPHSHGEVSLFGTPLRRDSASFRKRLGLIGHASMLYRDLSSLENLLFFGRLYGVPDARQRALRLLDEVGLAPRAGDPVKTFSRGMVQRVAIARALIHDPDLLLADEPFAGLDARSRQVLEETLAGLNRRGRTIILASHDIEQSLTLADQVLVLRRGALVLDRPSRATGAAEVLAEVTA